MIYCESGWNGNMTLPPKNARATIIAQMRKEIDEYRAEGGRMAQVLSSVGIDIDQRQPAIDENIIKSLATAASALSTIEFDDINLQLAASGLRNELHTTQRSVQRLQRRIQSHKKKLDSILEQHNEIEKGKKHLESQEEELKLDLSKMNKSTAFHSKKKYQYQGIMQSTKKLLNNLGFKEDISHEKLAELGNEVKCLEERLQTLRVSLKSYQDLPPSVAAAQVQLEEKKAVLSQLESRLADALGEVAISNVHEQSVRR